MPINKWIDKDVEYLYNGILHNLTKEWNYAICSNTDRPRDYHTKWARHRHISYDVTYMWNLKKMIQMNLCIKQKQTHWLHKTNLWLSQEKGRWEKLGNCD